MHQLARIGFTQSYTYFTWRTERGELEDYGRELAANAHYMRPNFFVNTPDILHESLQFGGPPMFKIRAVLAVDDEPHLGRLLRLRAVRARGRQARQRGVPRQREVLSCGRATGPRAEAVGPQPRALPAPAQRDPPGAPGAAAAAHAALPPGRQPEPALLLQDRPRVERRRPRRGQPVQPQHPDRDDGARPAGARAGLARAVRRHRRDHRRHATTGASSTTWSWTPTGSRRTSSRSPSPRPVQFPPPVA